MKISIRDKGKVHLSSLYYRKRFSKTNTTIATLQVNQLVFSHLSVAIRAFSIATYCHLLPHSGEKRGILSEKAEECLLFSTKNIKKVEKKLAVSNIFCIFATNRKNSCRFHLEANDSCETTLYTFNPKTNDTSRFSQTLLQQRKCLQLMGLLLQPAMSTGSGMCTLSVRNLQKTGTDQRLCHLSRCLPRQQVRTFPAATDDENGIRLYEYS